MIDMSERHREYYKLPSLIDLSSAVSKCLHTYVTGPEFVPYTELPRPAS